MELVKKKLSELVPYKYNPRRNDAAVEAVMESIKQCSYISPIVIDENMEILAGHTRYKALNAYCHFTVIFFLIVELSLL